MKTYVLNRDWAPFSKGDSFKGDGERDKLYALANNDAVLAKVPDGYLDEQGESCIWRPGEYETYYLVDDSGMVDANNFHQHDAVDNGRLRIGNCFKTLKEAKAMCNWIKARQNIINSGAKFINTIDVDSSQSYYGVYYTIDRGDLVIEDAYIGENTVGDKRLYFDDRQLADKSVREHRDDWLVYLGVNEKSGEEE